MAEMRPSFRDDIRDSQPYHELYQHCQNHPKLWNYVIIKNEICTFKCHIAAKIILAWIQHFCLHNICNQQKLFHQVFTVKSSENKRSKCRKLISLYQAHPTSDFYDRLLTYFGSLYFLVLLPQIGGSESEGYLLWFAFPIQFVCPSKMLLVLELPRTFLCW